MPAYFWRGTHNVSYGEGCALVVADDLATAREKAFLRLQKNADEDGVVLKREQSTVFLFAPDLTLDQNDAELVEWQE